MFLIKYFVTGIIFIVVAIINFINNGKRSDDKQNIFEHCNDEEINRAFNGLQITGVIFLENLLERKKFNLIVLDNGSIGAEVRGIKVIVERDFREKLNLETFRESLHEFRHVLDYNIQRLKSIILSIEIICLLVLTLTRLDIFKAHLPQNGYAFSRLILAIIIVINAIICGILDSILETKALKYPAENCEVYLNELFYDDNVIKKTKDYLTRQVITAIKWYKINIICRYSIIIVSVLAIF